MNTMPQNIVNSFDFRIKFLLILTLLFCLISGLRGQTKTIKISLKDKNAIASDLFSHVDYVKIETTSNSLLRYPADIVYDGDIMFIQDMQVLAFNREGKFINGFGRSGRGPGEWAGVRDYWVDREKKELLIYTGSNIISYSYTGEQIDSRSTYEATCFGKTKEGNYLFFNNYHPVILKGNKGTSDQFVILANPKNKIVSDFSDKIEHMGLFTGYANPSFISDYNGSLQIVPNRTSSVYQLEGNNLIHKYKFSFDSNNLPERIINNPKSFTQEEYKAYRADRAFEIDCYRESDNYATFWFYSKRIYYSAILDKKTDNVSLIPLKTFHNDITYHSFGYTIYLDNNKITTFIQANELIDNIEDKLADMKPQEKQEFIEAHSELMAVFEKTKRDDNPILVNYYFKK